MSTLLDASNIISGMFSQITALLHDYTQQGYQALSALIKVPLGTAIVLYLAITGLFILHGDIEVSVKEFSKRALKLALLYTFALSWSMFNQYFITLVSAITTDVSNAMMNIAATGSLHENTLGQSLQTVLNQVTAIADAYFKHGSLHNPEPYFDGFIIMLCGYAIVAIAALFILVNQIILAILLALAPLMVAFTLFRPTQSFFDRWLGDICGYSMSIVMLSATLGIIMMMMGWVFPSDASRFDVSPNGIVAPIVLAIISIGILLTAAQIGRAIGGGVSSASEKGALSGAVGGALLAGSLAKRHVAGAVGAGKRIASAGRSIMQKGQSTIQGIKNKLRQVQG